MPESLHLLGVNLFADGLVLVIGAVIIGTRSKRLLNVYRASSVGVSSLARAVTLAGLFRTLGALVAVAGLLLLL